MRFKDKDIQNPRKAVENSIGNNTIKSTHELNKKHHDNAHRRNTNKKFKKRIKGIMKFKPITWSKKLFGSLIDKVPRVRKYREEIERLKNLAYIDSLTGVFNRAAFDKILEAEIERCLRENKSLSILVIDGDKFKDINDNFGHKTGDKAIENIANHAKEEIPDEIKKELATSIAKVMKNQTRKYDPCFRYGGDEFCVILPNTNKEEVKKISDRIKVNIQTKVIHTKKGNCTVNVSIGYKTFSPNDLKNSTVKAIANSIFNNADEVLYNEKHQKKNS